MKDLFDQFDEKLLKNGVSVNMLKDPMVLSLANSCKNQINNNSRSEHTVTLAAVASSRIFDYLKALEVTKGICVNAPDKRRRVKTKAMLKDSPFSDDQLRERNSQIEKTEQARLNEKEEAERERKEMEKKKKSNVKK